MTTVIHGYDRLTGEPFASRSEVIGQNGMVATSHPLATQIGLDVLKNGANPGHMPVQYLKKPFIYLNITQAKELDLDISNEVKDRASKKY